MKIIPLGGLGEIGMNCMLLEHEDSIIVIDCGLLFTDLEDFGVEFAVPDFTYLLENRDKVKGIVITHGHEDHIGALPILMKKGLRVPIHCSAFSSLLIQERLKEYGLGSQADIQVFRSGESFKLGVFKIETVPVNHSIVEASALIIDTPVGKIIHTGDFKIDASPYYGDPLSLDRFRQAGDEGVLLLLSDSTNVERVEHSLSESSIMKMFEAQLSQARGLVVVSMFASNVGRMGQVFELAKKLGKKVVTTGRSMVQNVHLAMQCGYLKDAQGTLISMEQVDSYPRNKVVVFSSGSQGEYRSSLTRIALGEHRDVKLEKDDLVILSSKFIPGNELAIGRVINNLFRQGATVLYEAVHEVHVSGHATAPELQKMLECVRPKYFIPVHGEYRHLVHHAKLAQKTGVMEENTVIAVNGDIIELLPDRCKVTGHFEETRIFVEGTQHHLVTRDVIKERRKLAEKGIVIPVVLRGSSRGNLIGDPQVLSKGVLHEEVFESLSADAQRVVERVCKEYAEPFHDDFNEEDLEEILRLELLRFFKSRIGKKPVIAPRVFDI